MQRTRRFVPIDEDQVVEVRADSAAITDLDGVEVQPSDRRIEVEWDLAAAEKAGYADFMLKEIHEQPTADRATRCGAGSTADGRLLLDDLRMPEDQIADVDKVFVVACGTAFHAGLVAKYAIEHWTRLPVEIEIASEFRYRDPVLDAEHADAGDLAVRGDHRHAGSGPARRPPAVPRGGHHQHGRLLDRPGGRRASCTPMPGPSAGVAATKTFTTQMVAMYLLALYLAQVRGTMYPAEIAAAHVEQMQALPEQVERATALDGAGRASWPRRFAEARDVLFIGRHTGYPAALEGALKLKEISYIHAEGYPGGRAQARADRPGRAGRAGGCHRHRVPRLPEDPVEHPGGEGPGRRGHRRGHRGRPGPSVAGRPRPVRAADPRAALADRGHGPPPAPRLPHRRRSAGATWTSPGTWPRA